MNAQTQMAKNDGYQQGEPSMHHNNGDSYDANMEDGCPTEVANAPQTMTKASTAANGDYARPTRAEYVAAKERLEEARAAHAQRLREINDDKSLNIQSMPPLEELRSERMRLSEQVLHHKDEQDSLALDIEGLQGAAEVYQLAARVQRLEHFAERAHVYVEETLPKDIERTLEEDRHQSNVELCAYIEELQNRRSNTLKKVVASQEGMMKSRRQKSDTAKTAAQEQHDDPMDAKAAAHTKENKDECAVLQEKIRKFSSMRTKLQADILKEKNASKRMEERMQAHIRTAELANARDARMCGELNNGNAAATTNAQLLIDQLNVAHYGFGNAPSTKQLLEDRKERDASLEESEADQQEYGRFVSNGSLGSHQSYSNSLSSHQRVAKPPLVASKPTASQRRRESALREEREEVSVARTLGRSNSLFSEVRPPSVAAKSTASQRSRDAK
ncbi:hypothetical protein, conserved [Leishmania tarentolae]|uniref:Uncharacterized protein n=1 Tax=Leishmania tarentolae TaxID=5689 RepID=A0A640KWW4_LEITA|nr:hypothetical protein, conserved [Leishmania tarentolae]